MFDPRKRDGSQTLNLMEYFSLPFAIRLAVLNALPCRYSHHLLKNAHNTKFPLLLQTLDAPYASVECSRRIHS